MAKEVERTDKKGLSKEKLILIVLAVVVVLVVVMLIARGPKEAREESLGDEIDSDTGERVYENSQFGFRVSYPLDWNRKENSQGVVFEHVSVPGVSVNVIAQKLPSGSEQATSESYAKSIANTLRTTSVPYTLVVDSDPVNIFNYKSWNIVYTQAPDKQSPATTKTSTNFMVINGNVYELRYTSPLSSYGANLGDYAQIIKSFELI